MQNISVSAHLHRKTCNAASNSFYDDVFSGPNKFPLPPPSLSPRLQDYAEIFGAFNSRSSSSIPVLDLPLSVGAEDLFFDVRSACFDYSEVFGGFDGSDFAASFEELVRMSGGEDDEAWSPEEDDYLSEESEGSLNSEGFSNRESCEYVIDGNDMKFNISYNKNGGSSSCEDIAQSLPEYTFVVDKASSLPKMVDDDDDDYVSMRLSDDGHFNIDLSREMVIERPLKKTMSNLVNGDGKSGMLFEDEVRTRRDYVRTGSFPNETFVTISDVSLKTRPSKVPPPSRPPPPALEIKKKVSNELIPNGKASAFEGSVGDGSLPFLDVEVDANSSAAVSAAAIIEAMEKAQAKMKSAKELMDRKREGFQCHTRSGLKDDRKDREGNIGRCIDGLGSNEGIETEIGEEKQYVKRTNRLVQHSLEGGNYPNGSKREENQARESLSSQGSVKIDEASEWKEATEFFELVRTDKSKNIFDHVINESMSAQSRNVIEHGRKEQKENDKKGKLACEELEEYERKVYISKEVSASQENNGRPEAPVVVHRQKGLQKKAQRSKEASRQKESEKKLMTDMQLAETARKHMITDDFQVNENMVVQYQEIKLEVMEAKRYKEKEPHSEEANKRFTHEKNVSEWRKREALEKLDNEKTLNTAFEQANKERRLKEDMMEQAEKEKRREAHGLEENETNKKEALEREENVRRLREALEREENERRLSEALEQEENEKRRMETFEREESERSLREALEQEENERKLREAFEMQENERRRRETLEKEQKERRLREALEMEENERRLKQKLEKEENERRLRQKLEKEENERRLRQKLEKEENERRLRQKLEKENERRQRETFEREENGRRLKESLEKKEKEKRERQACEKEEHNLPKMAFVLEVCQKNQVEACGKEEIQKVQKNDFGNVKTESSGKRAEKIEQENKPLREAQVGKGAEGLKEIRNLEDFEGTSLEAHKPDTPEDTQDSYQNEAAGANANIDGEKIPSDMCRDDLECENASEISSEDGSVKSADEVGHNLQPRKFASHKSSALNQEKIYTHESYEKGSKIEKAQVFQQSSFPTESAASEMKENTLRPAQQVNASQAAERKMKNFDDSFSVEDKYIERIKREKVLEMERLRKMEEERDREREREKDRMAVDLATLEARERANSDARERAERAAIERALAETRQRAMNEARERLEKACAEARDKSLNDKASVEARIRAERAAVERATAEARERAFEKAMVERAASEARERLERSVSDKFSTSRNSGMRKNSLSSDVQDMQMQNSGSFSGSRYQYSSVYGGYSIERSDGVEGESPQRCKARLERHRRTAERAAKALAEKNMRDLLAQREQAERNRIAETLDAEVRRWSSGKEGNLRALLSTLQYILGPDSGWHPIPLTEVITSAAVKKAYRKATLCVHPDKLQQRGASIHQKYVCEKVFDLLKEAWNKFNSEER